MEKSLFQVGKERNKVKVNRTIHISLWESIKLVIENDVPETVEDHKALMGLLSKVAQKFKDTSRGYWINLTDDECYQCWNCLNITLLNKMVIDQKKIIVMLAVMKPLGHILEVKGLIEKKMEEKPSELTSIKKVNLVD